MKTMNAISRRKKIRTRKSLNEIRKKSRRLISPETKPTKRVDEVANNPKRNHFVTSNRLTIAMFPNAIQSETVTRFGNDGAKKKLNLNFKDLIKDRDDLNISNELVENEKYTDSENSIQCISDDEQRSDANNDCLESRRMVNRESNVTQSTLHDTPVLSPQTEALPQAHYTYDKYYANYLYEQLMSEISPYLNKNIPKSLLTEDVIDNLKQQLRSLRIQSRSNVVMLKRNPAMSAIHISNASEDIVLEDPMDYIRLSYSNMQNTSDIESECSISTSDSADSLFHMHSPQPVVSSSSRTDLSDTPEYIYFPHKLN